MKKYYSIVIQHFIIHIFRSRSIFISLIKSFGSTKSELFIVTTNVFDLLDYCKCINCRKIILTHASNKKMSGYMKIIFEQICGYLNWGGSCRVFFIIIQGGSNFYIPHQHYLLVRNENSFLLSTRKKKKTTQINRRVILNF